MDLGRHFGAGLRDVGQPEADIGVAPRAIESTVLDRVLGDRQARASDRGDRLGPRRLLERLDRLLVLLDHSQHDAPADLIASSCERCSRSRSASARLR